jgi:hypothetical protein
MSPKKATQKSAESTTASGRKSKGFTDEERAALKERAREVKAEARRGPRAGKADGESPFDRSELSASEEAWRRRPLLLLRAAATELFPPAGGVR